MTDDYNDDQNADDFTESYPPNSHPLERFGRTLVKCALVAWIVWLWTVAR
jgi:hypothetical protein